MILRIEIDVHNLILRFTVDFDLGDRRSNLIVWNGLTFAIDEFDMNNLCFWVDVDQPSYGSTAYMDNFTCSAIWIIVLETKIHFAM